jgi:photosystem II stability/assembly factor-like uncharacterized protein
VTVAVGKHRVAKLGVLAITLLVGPLSATRPRAAFDRNRSLSRELGATPITPVADGGNVTKILVETENGHRLYATLYFSWLHVISDGRFAQWQASIPAETLPGAVSVYASDASFSNLYLRMRGRSGFQLYGQAIFHSGDHAASWQIVPRPPNGNELAGFAVTSSNPPTLYYAPGSDFIYSSSDDGQTWTQLTSGPTSVSLIFTDPKQPAVVFAYGTGSEGSASLFKSVDGGSSWTAFQDAPIPEDENSLVVDPTDSSRLYVGGSGGVFRSADGGKSWSKSANGFTQIDLTPFAQSIVVDPLNPKVLMTLATSGNSPSGLFKSVDSGETWTQVGDLAQTVPNCLALDPLDDDIIYVGTSLDGVLRSIDGGHTWSPYDAGLANALVGNMSTARYGRHTVTVLNDGSALIAGGDDAGGGSGSISLCERFDPVTNLFSPTGSMTVRREDHTATLLQDGRVVVTGGMQSFYIGSQTLNSSEIYDPSTGTWTPAADMQFARRNSSAALLPDGRVLVIGGQEGGGSTVGEIFDPTRNVFTTTAPLPVAQRPSSATTLLDGSVLVTLSFGNTPSSDAFLYDYRTDQWTPTQPLPLGVIAPSATRLSDGRVLLFEGGGEIFDPSTRTFSVTSAQIGPVVRPTPVALDDGRVYFCCGSNLYGGLPSFLTNIYDPVTDSFELGPQTALEREKAVAVRLKDGRVLLVGGSAAYVFQTPWNGGEVFLPASHLTPVTRSRNRIVIPPWPPR